MKLIRSFLALALTFALSLLSFITLPTYTAIAQDAKVALQRGYRTGYSDGYMAGYRDAIDGTAKNVTRHNEYFEARRAYNKDYGQIEDYRDGYQQGFESGYDTGFEKRSFESTTPASIARRGIKTETSISAADNPAPPAESAPSEPTVAIDANGNETRAAEPATPDTLRQVSFRPQSDAVIIIPRDTEIILELSGDLATNNNREGDQFTAKVVSPSEISGAVIEGRIDKIVKPGRIKKRSGMLLSFDRIVLSETRWSNFDAILTEVLPVRGDNVRRVDGEGAAIGKSTLKPDIVKVSAATGTGAGVGALTGGPVGAAVGASVGAAFGVGAVIIERGKHIHLAPSQQLRIKTSYETKIR
ncbi:MAG: DUF2799 domain-containing protein [Acidobacteria bacterium]|nr:DUF2799 domain-containing protein [Acidobacteriota bacterium]